MLPEEVFLRGVVVWYSARSENQPLRHKHRCNGNAAKQRARRELQPLNTKATLINLNLKADKL